MSTELKDKVIKDIKMRNLTPRSVIGAIKNSLRGIMWYARDGKSFIIYCLGLLFEIIMGFAFSINGLEWILIICILGVILAVELLNTAIEATCDAITKEYNKLIMVAKDCASAATFVIFVVAVILNLIIFIPKIFI